MKNFIYKKQKQKKIKKIRKQEKKDQIHQKSEISIIIFFLNSRLI